MQQITFKASKNLKNRFLDILLQNKYIILYSVIFLYYFQFLLVFKSLYIATNVFACTNVTGYLKDLLYLTIKCTGSMS